ncbi:DUF2769 domain-containing protein [Methanoregula sp.]|uniref:DUF2769 domain-containing protein n=1 Tax=Methanoregula sp. TaxID=2052170 RepID=UPI003FD7377B
MFESGKPPVVENTEENRQTCRKYCTICQNYRRHTLEKYPPTELFCGCGTSSAPSMKEIGCFCPACPLFTKHHLRGGYYCVRM